VGIDFTDRFKVAGDCWPDGRLVIAHRRQQATGCDSQYGVAPGNR
jgi:hypothetical protein